MRQNILIILAVLIIAGIGVLVQVYEPQEEQVGISTQNEQSATGDKKFINKKGEEWGPLPEGEYDFQIASSEGTWPKFLEGTIDPPDVHVGDVQKFRIVVQSPSGIVSVTAQIETDNGTTTLPLTRTGIVTFQDMTPEQYVVENNTVKPLSPIETQTRHLAKIGEEENLLHMSARASVGEKEVWEGEWVVHDTHDTYYHTTFIAEDAIGRKNSITLAWSDLCGIPLAANWSSSGGCTISTGQVDGVETDGATYGLGYINTGHNIVVNGTLSWSPGGHIAGDLGIDNAIILSGGTITIGLGGQLKETYVWALDQDNDNYAGNFTTFKAQDTQPTNYARKNTILSSSDADCLDSGTGAGYVYRNIASMGTDPDQDRWVAGGFATQCVGVKSSYWYRATSGGYEWISSTDKLAAVDCAPLDNTKWTNMYPDNDGDGYGVSPVTCMGSGGVSNATDCCDTDANAKPGQTAWFTSPRTTCGGYDYNCNSSTEYQITAVTYCLLVKMPEKNFLANLKDYLLKKAVAIGEYGWHGGNPGCGNSGPFNYSNSFCEGLGGEPYKTSACH